nr:putative ribonuclease H-like domain-containing protein [Tanacetum cinerariifolium]
MAKQVELNKRKNKVTCERNDRPVWNNVQRLNHQNKFVPIEILTKTRRFPVNDARQIFFSQAASTSTVRKVNTARPIVNETRPRINVYKSHSPFRQPFNRTTVPKANFANHKVNTAGDKTITAVRGNRETAIKTSVDNLHKTLKENGIVDSGCSRHMTGNKAYLVEYQDFNGGPVSFGGSKGQITSKGKIRTRKLDFEDVYFVKELQNFNLFSVSQMYDKKNKVLLTNTECLVLSPGFKLPDANQVLLRVPTQNNMYSFNLDNIVPSRDLACLIAKAIVDESNKWHRRLGHPVTTENKANKTAGPKEANNSVGAARANSTNNVNTASKPVNTASTPVNTAGLSRNVSAPDLSTSANQDDSQIPSLKDIYEVPNYGIFTNASYDDEGAVADFINLESTVNEELLPFKNQQVWILVDLPFRKKVIKTKWVYRNKKDTRGVVVRNKARLVAQGHRQEEGIDYDEVFALVARIKATRIFLAFAYMGFIVCFIDPKFLKNVDKVIKALYGLHQAPRAWYATLSTFLVQSGYRRGLIDKTLFIKKDKNDSMLVQVYADDIIFGSIKKSWCNEFEELMKSRFQMSSMGELTFFLGLQVKQRKDGIFISHDKSVTEILKKFVFISVKTASSPIETKKTLVKDVEAADVDVHLYRSMIGSLMYLTASRPDIMYAGCACSRFQVTSKTSHLHAMKKIFRYLKGQPKLGLWYPKESAFDLEAYLDSDYAGANLNRKYTTRGCQFLGRRLILWQCKKQTIVATSTTEAEYVAAASCCGKYCGFRIKC